jgi:hypothetical protein
VSQETVRGGAEEVNSGGRQLKTDWAKPLNVRKVSQDWHRAA